MSYALLGIIFQRILLAVNNYMGANINSIVKYLLIATVICFIVSIFALNATIARIGGLGCILLIFVKFVTSRPELSSTIVGLALSVYVIIIIKRNIIENSKKLRTKKDLIKFYLF